MMIFEFKKIRKSAIPIILIFFNLVGTLLGTMMFALNRNYLCLLYTSDAADEL